MQCRSGIFVWLLRLLSDAVDRTREADLAKRVEEHHRLGAEHEKQMAALTEEHRLLHGKADEARRGLEPHAKCAFHCAPK